MIYKNRDTHTHLNSVQNVRVFPLLFLFHSRKKQHYFISQFIQTTCRSQPPPWPHLIVATAEEVLSEAVRDRGAHPQDFGHVFSTDHHVPIVELNVHVGLLVQQIVGAAGRSETDQLPEIAVQLVASWSLGWSSNFIYNS